MTHQNTTTSANSQIRHSLSIIYMGTPDFAVAGLRALVEKGYNVVAVVTMPDKPAGRGHKLQFSPVKEYALSQGLPVLQPERLKDETFLSQLRSYNADLQIVTAFRMLPEAVWAMPRLGTFNLHASLLPQYRGAAPINWAIINGEKQTGVTTFMLKHEIDTGDMIMQRSITIGEDEDAGSLHDRLMALGVEVTLQTVDLIAQCDHDNTPLPLQPQPDNDTLKPAPKIFRETCEIDFTESAVEVCDFIRGLSPYPGAWCHLRLAQDEEVVKIYKAYPTSIPRSDTTATGDLAINQTDKSICIACQDYYIQVVELQRPNKRRMTTKEALNGLR